MRSEVTILIGDVLEKLRELPDESVQCCVTSVPYWGLRDYSRCDCSVARLDEGGGTINIPEEGGNKTGPMNYRKTEPNPSCPNCHGTGKIAGVAEAQIGLEASIDAWVVRLVEVFREVRRVLRSDGVMWLNVGDCYTSGNRADFGPLNSTDKQATQASIKSTPRAPTPAGLKPKDLVGQPWRLAFALQADGWWLRSDVIWSKPNPMPESVRDRPTKSHEYVFLMSKSARYYYDADAVREKLSDVSIAQMSASWTRKTSKHASERNDGAQWAVGSNPGAIMNPAGRNLRSVWQIPTQPYPEAHFATFPEALPERCIKAGTSEKGACGSCGAPWKRTTQKKYAKPAERKQAPQSGHYESGKSRGADEGGMNSGDYPTGLSVDTTGWEPTCECNGKFVKKVVVQTHYGDWSNRLKDEERGPMTKTSGRLPRKEGDMAATEKEVEQLVYEPAVPLGAHPIKPCVVLDPFAGSGTTGAVAKRLRQSAILIELNPLYADLIKKRVGKAREPAPPLDEFV